MVEDRSFRHADAAGEEARLLAVYENAVSVLTPLSRAVYLMKCVDDLTYRQITARLAVDSAIVEACMINAIAGIAWMVDGHEGPGKTPAQIEEAEAALHQQYRGYCAGMTAGGRAASIRRLFGWPTHRSVKPFDEWLRVLGPSSNRRSRQ